MSKKIQKHQNKAENMNQEDKFNLDEFVEKYADVLKSSTNKFESVIPKKQAS